MSLLIPKKWILREVRALTAMGRASANLLACWPAVMVGALYVFNADYIRPLWETDAGHTMMMVSGIMIVGLSTLIERRGSCVGDMNHLQLLKLRDTNCPLS